MFCGGVPVPEVRRSRKFVLFVLLTAAQRMALGKAGGRLPANASTPSRASGLAAQEQLADDTVDRSVELVVGWTSATRPAACAC